MHLGVAELRRRRGVHQVAGLDHNGIGIGGSDVTVPGDILIEFDVHQAVLFERMHLPRLALARLKKAERFGYGHLVDNDLALRERRLGNAVARLNNACPAGVRRGAYAGGAGKKLADRNGVGGIVGALVDDLEDIVRSKDRGGHLHAAGAPAVGHWHFAAGEGYLIARNSDRLEDGAPDCAFALLVEVGKVVGNASRHRAAPSLARTSATSRSPPRATSHSARSCRSSASSAWKST